MQRKAYGHGGGRRNFRSSGFHKRSGSGFNRSAGQFENRSSGRYFRLKNSGFDISRCINKAVSLEEEKYVAKNSFQAMEIHDVLKQNIVKKGYTDPMPIQDQAIPELLSGKDLIGIANTGMGKTAAFLIPLINKTVKEKYQKTLIVTPTRELANQIQTELVNLSFGLSIWSVSCIGGMSMGKQISDLRRNHHFVIGTPGRLKDLSNRRYIRLSDYNNVVVDEVDRMFDIGFARDIKFLLDQLPKTRQSLFFSATISPQVEALVNNYSNSPVRVSVKTRDTAATVNQDVVYTQGKAKIEVLHDLLNKQEFTKILIFGKTKHGVQKLADELQGRGFRTDAIHGNKSQHQRQRALQNFKQGSVQILVATDVAARGIDIPDVSHVINYDLPQSYEDYIHRIGRTGRANKIGTALTFV